MDTTCSEAEHWIYQFDNKVFRDGNMKSAILSPVKLPGS